MKKYNHPLAEVVETKPDDIITLSAPDDLANYDETVTAPDDWFS